MPARHGDEGIERNRVVIPRSRRIQNSLAQHAVNREPERADERDRIADHRRRVSDRAAFRLQQHHAAKRQRHAGDFRRRKRLESHRARENQDQDRSERLHQHRASRGGIAQAHHKAALIQHHAEKSQIRERPEVAQLETGALAPQEMHGEHEERGQIDPQRRERQRAHVPQRDFAGGVVDRPEQQDQRKGRTQQHAARPVRIRGRG